MTRFARLLALVVLVAILAAPHALAQSNPRQEVRLAFKTIDSADLFAVITMPEGFARGVRDAADTNRDGDVSEAEQKAFENGFSGDDGRDANVRLDGLPMFTRGKPNVTTTGVRGPVTQSGPVIAYMDGHARLNESPAPAAEHTVSGDVFEQNEAFPFDASVTIRVPPGFTITRVEQMRALDDCEARAEGANATIFVVFAPAPGACPPVERPPIDTGTKKDETPGFGVIASVAALSLVSGAVRRSRTRRQR